MELIDLRNTLREWFLTRKAATPAISATPIVKPNEKKEFGLDVTYLRFSVQTSPDARVIGVGSGTKRRRRNGRVFVEVMTPTAVGDGAAGEIATVIEQIWRDAMVADQSPHQHIMIGEPSSFERDEKDRYCQVVSVPFQVDHFA